MELAVYSVWDEKVTAFSTPWTSLTDAQACRTFDDLLSDPSVTMSRHPEDYKLYRVGTFDQKTGEMREPLTGRVELLRTGTDVVMSRARTAEGLPAGVEAVQVRR